MVSCRARGCREGSDPCGNQAIVQLVCGRYETFLCKGHRVVLKSIANKLGGFSSSPCRHHATEDPSDWDECSFKNHAQPHQIVDGTHVGSVWGWEKMNGID